MSKHRNLWGLVACLLAFSAAWAQDNSAQQPPPTSPDNSAQQPAPAYGPESQAPAVSENPPISGLDLPNLEPHAAPLSYLQPGAHFSESVSSNLENNLGGSKTGSITDALGSLELQRLWSNYDLSLDYLGGIGYYGVNGIGLRQIEELGVYQKINWKRGYVGVRDAFSYQPEGTFGSAYGSVATLGAGLTTQSTLLGGSGLGALGQVPRIMNLALLDVVENLTPKSSVTATGGYGFVHFLGNEPGTGASFIGNTQISGQVAYDRLLGPHDQAALAYIYEAFKFSTGVSFRTQVIQLMWGHRISGRMDFLAAIGPQITQINNELIPVTNPTSADTIPPCLLSANLQLECPSNNLRISAAGRISLRYRFPKTSLDASYSHFTTAGSGFFAGAQSDLALLTVTRPLTRVWTVFSDIGYSRNSRVLPSVCPLGTTGTGCPGVSANTYQYGFAGLGARRNFGHDFKAFVSYQFNELSFDNSFCATSSPCSRISQRHVGSFGLDWTPRPTRLD